MTNYVKITNGAPEVYSLDQLRKDHPHTSIPNNLSALAEYDVYKLIMVDAPSVATSQIAVPKDVPELIDGAWTYNWTVRNKTQQEINNEKTKNIEMIKVERDRRLEADFNFIGKPYQRDRTSLARITGAATLAGFAIGAGAQPNDYRWANPDRDFGWIASDDTVTLMDAQTCFAFGQAAAEIETSIVYAAKALREMDPIPADYTDDKWWP